MRLNLFIINGLLAAGTLANNAASHGTVFIKTVDLYVYLPVKSHL